LIQQLASDKFREREAATEALKKRRPRFERLRPHGFKYRFPRRDHPVFS